LEFAYSQAPSFMQGLVMGLFLMTSGIGNYVSEAILEIVKEATGTDTPGMFIDYDKKKRLKKKILDSRIWK
jgi:dipeptide/tripeptide permease